MTNVLNSYAAQFKGWHKALGSKPTAEQLTTAHVFGRPGKQSLALAMAMRPEGVTASQIVMACGAPQNNHRRDVLAAGYFRRDMNAPASDAGHTVYKIALTPKGENEIKKRTSANEATTAPTAKPAKVKAKAKGKAKPKAKAKATPTSDVPTVAPTVATDTVTEATPATPTATVDNSTGAPA